jgi:hypothetical protein
MWLSNLVLKHHHALTQGSQCPENWQPQRLKESETTLFVLQVVAQSFYD